ncbi:MAG: hypothetical protein KY428_07520, partial [Bacteroidetes bacterium]|nr:hypothetical protein [Bacteroidota bacterium]
LGGKVLRVVAPKRVAVSGLSEEARMHRSETALNDYVGFDGFINNDPEHAATVRDQVHMLLLNT